MPSGFTSSLGRIFGATLSNVARVTTTRTVCSPPHFAVSLSSISGVERRE